MLGPRQNSQRVAPVAEGVVLEPQTLCHRLIHCKLPRWQRPLALRHTGPVAPRRACLNVIAPRSPTEETSEGGLYFVAKKVKRARKRFQPPSERF